MERHHIHKDSVDLATDPSSCDDLIGFADAAEQESEDDIQYAALTDSEISATFGGGTNTPGPDGVSAQLIDRADRPQMTKCLSMLYNSVDVWSVTSCVEA